MCPAFFPVQSEAPSVFRFDARGIARRFRQVAIVASLDTLRRGETLRVVDERDLQPLLEQIANRYGDALAVRYLERDRAQVVVDFERH